MKIAVFSTKPYDKTHLEASNKTHGHELTYLEARLSSETVALADGHEGVCAFVNDTLDRSVLHSLKGMGIQFVALRAAGFNNVDMKVAKEQEFCVCRVPAYSPHAVAEHTVALALALNRKLHRAYSRVRDGNFALSGLLGFDMHGKTAGIVGTGKIGAIAAKLFHGFGMKILAYDIRENDEVKAMGAKYVDLPELYAGSDIVSLHCPLTPQTYHLINGLAVSQMKTGVMLINTSRGALIDTVAVVDGLKSGKVGYLGLDVYEEESDLFFEDLSDEVIHDDVFARLLTFPNVFITGHQGYFTRNALKNIAETTLQNITDYEKNKTCSNSVFYDQVKGG